MILSIISAMDTNLAIGKNGQLLYHIPEDLAHFSTLTIGHPVIMGRKTFRSIILRNNEPLPERHNIVLSRQKHVTGIYGASAVSSLTQALKLGAKSEEVFVIGGAEVYKEALPLADKLYLTLIHDSKEGDAYFPPYEHLFKKVRGEMKGWKGLVYEFAEFEKK